MVSEIAEDDGKEQPCALNLLAVVDVDGKQQLSTSTGDFRTPSVISLRRRMALESRHVTDTATALSNPKNFKKHSHSWQC